MSVLNDVVSKKIELYPHPSGGYFCRPRPGCESILISELRQKIVFEDAASLIQQLLHDTEDRASDLSTIVAGVESLSKRAVPSAWRAQYLRQSPNGVSAIGKTLGIVIAAGEEFVESENDALLQITTLMVHQDARGRGVGRALVQFVEQEAKSRGYRGLAVNCLPENDPAPDLYESEGFYDSGYTRYVKKFA